jgi:hypothetical protein
MSKKLKPSKQRLDQLLTSLGYASRSESKKLIASGLVTIEGKSITKSDFKAFHHEVLFDGEPLDPPQGMAIMMHKPAGYVCSHDDGEGKLVYDLLPPRWRNRDPKISTIGRLPSSTTYVCGSGESCYRTAPSEFWSFDTWGVKRGGVSDTQPKNDAILNTYFSSYIYGLFID